MYIEGASTFAASHDYLMLWVNIVTIGAFIILNSVLIYFIFKYRRRSENDITSSIDHSMTLEVAWTAIPTLIMAWLFIWGLVEFIKLRTVPENAMEINVTAKQWTWDFIYPAELGENPKQAIALKTANVLYLEEGRPTKLIMKSTDVLHSFFVPAFRVKEDVVPNMYTYTSFTPIIPPAKKGNDQVEYNIFCTEYCGKNHSYMLAKAVILSPSKFRQQMARIATEASNISAKRGEAIHQANCKSCHSLDGSRLVGPSFKELWKSERQFTDDTKAVADENYIRNSILNPNLQVVKDYPAAMPPQNYSEAEIQSIIEYIKTIK